VKFLSDRYWDDNGQPFIFEGETIEISVPNVSIGGTYTSKNELDVEDLKEGELYITTNRVVFIGKVRESKKERENFDGVSIFLEDLESMKREKKKFSLLCNVKSGKRGKRARIYFKNIEDETLERIDVFLNKKILELNGLKVGSKPIEKKEDKKTKKDQEKTDKRTKKERTLFEEADVDSIELICPACGSDVKYKPGMKKCPICNKEVNFL